MFIKSDNIERRVHEAVGPLANDKFFKREGKIDQVPTSVSRLVEAVVPTRYRQFGKMLNGAIESRPKMPVWQAESNGWDEV
jgi:hypothetical protein